MSCQLLTIFCLFLKHYLSHADGEIRFSPTDMHTTNYHIVGVDLRSIDEVANKLKQSDVDFEIPTIFLGN
jgi:hypothetical protein